MNHADKWLASAIVYLERHGFSILPVGEDKKPAVSWKEFQDRRPTILEVLSWPREKLGIVTGRISGIVVVDCESREDALWFWRERGKTPMVVQTRRGYHLYFRHPGEEVKNGIKIDDRYDVRGDRGYVLAPPSPFEGGCYRWRKGPVATAQLPVFRSKWRPEPPEHDFDKVISDGWRYIQQIVAVAGQGGHDDTYRAACCLRKAGYSEAEAFCALQSWNKTNADPPWRDRDLLHKTRDAYK